MSEEIRRGLQRIYNELETPSYVWEDVVNSLTYVCFCLKKDAIETDAAFKIRLIDESSGNIQILQTLSSLPICIGAINKANIEATLTAHKANGYFKYV